jgi:hypothetical protein
MTLERVSSQDALVKLRGPVGGYAHAHAGLAAFWRHVERDILPCPLAPEDRAMLEALDAWLVSGTRRALLMGQDEARRTALLARWALSVAERAAAVVFFLPVSPSFGTAVQREVHKVLLGLYATAGSTWFCSASNPGELKNAIAEGLTHVNYVIPQSGLEQDEDAEDPAILLIVDGLERTADPVSTERVLYLDDTSKCVRVLVSVGAPGPSENASTWRERQYWAQEDTTVFELPAVPALAEESVTRARRALEATGEDGRLAARTLDALSAVLAPVARNDLTASLDLPVAAIQALEVAPLAARELLVVEPDGTSHFRDDAVRARWAASVDTGAIEDSLVARGLSSLASGKLPEGADAWPAYLVEYLGAHMVRRGVARADLMRLVSPAWLAIWMRRSGGLVGFMTDARRARLAAEDALFDATTEVERLAPLHDLVWCAVVEGSLLAKEGSRHEDRDLTQPYRESTVDLGRPTGAARARAETLCTLAGLLSGPEHDQVVTWLHAARATLGDGPELRPRPVPAVEWEPATSAQVDPELARRLREKDPHFVYLFADNPRAACLVLGPEEALAQARAEESYWHGTLFASIAPHLPDPLRRQVVAEAIGAFSLVQPDRDLLPRLFVCAPWMSDNDACWLFCAVLRNNWEDDLFAGPRGLTDLVPLLFRLGGSAAIFDVASTLVTVGRWLP